MKLQDHNLFRAQYYTNILSFSAVKKQKQPLNREIVCKTTAVMWSHWLVIRCDTVYTGTTGNLYFSFIMILEERFLQIKTFCCSVCASKIYFQSLI